MWKGKEERGRNDDEPKERARGAISKIALARMTPLLSNRGTQSLFVFLFHNVGASNTQDIRDTEQERGAEVARKG